MGRVHFGKQFTKSPVAPIISIPVWVWWNYKLFLLLGKWMNIFLGEHANIMMRSRMTQFLFEWRMYIKAEIDKYCLGPRVQTDDIFTCILINENCCILIELSLKYVRKDPIDNNPALVQIMAWRRSGDKPLFEPMMISLPTHICVTRPQWVKTAVWNSFK